MAATTVTPVPTVATVADAIQLQIAALAHKNVTVSYTLVGVLVFVLALAGAGAWLGLHFVDAQLARAENLQTQYNASLKTLSDALAADAAQRTQASAQQAATIKIVDTRDDQANKAIQTATAPGASAQDAAAALGSAYSDVPAFGAVYPTPDGKIALEPAQAQASTATKIDRDRLSADLTDTTKLLTLEQSKTTSLTTDLHSCSTELTAGQKVIAGYKTVAKESRLKKIIHGAESGAGIAAGFLLGIELGRKL